MSGTVGMFSLGKSKDWSHLQSFKSGKISSYYSRYDVLSVTNSSCQLWSYSWWSVNLLSRWAHEKRQGYEKRHIQYNISQILHMWCEWLPETVSSCHFSQAHRSWGRQAFHSWAFGWWGTWSWWLIYCDIHYIFNSLSLPSLHLPYHLYPHRFKTDASLRQQSVIANAKLRVRMEDEAKINACKTS